jgi:16S rRNA (guanine966-N2)-methyltransferase
VRVIAGSLRGQNFDSPGTHRTHPMSDKMRGALFNILGDIEDLSVLDAFGGTGALSFEAISRGAKQATIIESDMAAQKTIARNIHELHVEQKVSLIKATAQAWLRTTQNSYDIILCDPPYDDLQTHVLAHLATRVRPNGILVISYPGDLAAPDELSLPLLKQQHYGDAQLLFYRMP